MTRQREDHGSNDEAGAAHWAHQHGRDDDNQPTRRELDRDEADAMDGTGYWGWWGR